MPRAVDPVLRLTNRRTDRPGEENLVLQAFCLLPRALYETALGLEPFDAIPVCSTGATITTRLALLELPRGLCYSAQLRY